MQNINIGISGMYPASPGQRDFCPGKSAPGRARETIRGARSVPPREDVLLPEEELLLEAEDILPLEEESFLLEEEDPFLSEEEDLLPFLFPEEEDLLPEEDLLFP